MKVENFREMSVGDLMELILLISKDNTKQMRNNNLLSDEEAVKGLTDENGEDLKTKLSKENLNLTKENNQVLELFNKILKFRNEVWPTLDYVIEEPKKELEAVEVNAEPKKEIKKKWFWQKNKSSLEEKSHKELNKMLQGLIEEEKYEECSKIQRIINKKTKSKSLLKIKFK